LKSGLPQNAAIFSYNLTESEGDDKNRIDDRQFALQLQKIDFYSRETIGKIVFTALIPCIPRSRRINHINRQAFEIAVVR